MPVSNAISHISFIKFKVSISSKENANSLIIADIDGAFNKLNLNRETSWADMYKVERSEAQWILLILFQ